MRKFSRGSTIKSTSGDQQHLSEDDRNSSVVLDASKRSSVTFRSSSGVSSSSSSSSTSLSSRDEVWMKEPGSEKTPRRQVGKTRSVTATERRHQRRARHPHPSGLYEARLLRPRGPAPGHHLQELGRQRRRRGRKRPQKGVALQGREVGPPEVQPEAGIKDGRGERRRRRRGRSEGPNGDAHGGLKKKQGCQELVLRTVESRFCNVVVNYY